MPIYNSKEFTNVMRPEPIGLGKGYFWYSFHWKGRIAYFFDGK